MYTLKGELIVIEDVQQISDSFKKREFVIKDQDEKYPQTVLFQSVQDRCDLLNEHKVGDLVEVSFNLRGREWANPKDGVIRYFNSLDAWKIEKIEGAAEEKNETFVTPEDDDLPF